MMTREEFKRDFPRTNAAKYIQKHLQDRLVTLRSKLEVCKSTELDRLQGEIATVRAFADLLCIKVNQELTSVDTGSSDEHL